MFYGASKSIDLCSKFEWSSGSDEEPKGERGPPPLRSEVPSIAAGTIRAGGTFSGTLEGVRSRAVQDSARAGAEVHVHGGLVIVAHEAHRLPRHVNARLDTLLEA